MDEILKRSVEYYASISKSSNETVRVGRFEEDAHKEEAIWFDILAKLQPGQGQKVLDIGVEVDFSLVSGPTLAKSFL